MSYKLTTLPNGLRVASELLPGLESVTVCVSVDVGARFEDEKDSGISHLLEHMAFKGTKRRTARMIAEAFDDIGGHSNAYTSLEHTVYYARILKDNLPVALDVLADILQNSTFDEAELERERQVIIQEIAMHFDSPDDLIFDYFHEVAYPDQPIGRSILGTAKHIKRFTRHDLDRYMRHHYHAPNMVVSAAGNLNHGEMVEQIGELFKNFPTASAPKSTEAHYIGGDYRKPRDLEQLHIMLGFSSVTLHHPDYYAAQLLSTMLGGGMSSRLFQEVREKRGLAYTVQSFLTPYEDSGIFGIYAAISENKAADLMPVVCDEINKLATTLTEKELIRAKNQQKASLLMARESSTSVAEWIGRHLLVFDRYKTVDEIRRSIDSVTLEQVKRMAETLNSTQPLTFAALGPQGKLSSYEDISKRLKA